MPGILWLASYPKSGNTWLRIFIENLFRNTAEPAPINDLGVVRYGDAMVPLYEQAAGRSLAACPMGRSTPCGSRCSGNGRPAGRPRSPRPTTRS